MEIPDFSHWGNVVSLMRRLKLDAFPADSLVEVNDDRFHGVGISTGDRECPIEKVAVRVESLNVWWYPVENCKPFTGKMPAWAKRWLRSVKAKRAYPANDVRRHFERRETEPSSSSKSLQRAVLSV